MEKKNGVPIKIRLFYSFIGLLVMGFGILIFKSSSFLFPPESPSNHTWISQSADVSMAGTLILTAVSLFVFYFGFKMIINALRGKILLDEL